MERNEPERADAMAEGIRGLIKRVSGVFQDIYYVCRQPGEHVCDEIRATLDALEEAEARMFDAIDLLDKYGIY